MVTMFREGERVTLTPREGGTTQAVELTVRGISGNTLTVDAFRAQVPFAAGSAVASVDDASATFLIAAIPQDTRVSVLTVQGFAPGQSVRLTVGALSDAAAAGATAIRLNAAAVAALAQNDWIWIQGNTGQEEAQADVVRITGAVAANADVSISPALSFAHTAGREVRRESFTLKVIGNAPNQRLDLGQRLRVPEFYLVYSGMHTVDISPI